VTDPTAEAMNWALERAARIAEETIPTAVGQGLAAKIRGLAVESESVSLGTPEELEEMDAIARMRVPRENLAAVAVVAGQVAPDAIASAPYASPEEWLAPAHEHDRAGPMVPRAGRYVATCTCGHEHLA
jgi:hypothetical protein